MPFKATAPLIVNPNTVLSFAPSLQSFQAVCRRDPKVIKISGSMDHNQSAFRYALNVLWQFIGKMPFKDLFSLFASKCLDHKNIIILKDNIIKGYVLTLLYL
jgi:hypothetical protein